MFLLPMLAVLFGKDCYLADEYRSLEQPSQEKIVEIYQSAEALFGIFEMVAFVLFFFFFSGAIRVVRQLLWREPVFFKEDYKLGIADNKGSFLASSCVVSLFELLLRWQIPSPRIQVLEGILAVCIVPIGIWVLLLAVYYRLRFRAIIQNAVICYIRTLPVTLLLLAVTALPFLLVFRFQGLTAVKYLVLACLAFFYIIPVVMVWLLYASNIFDRYINQKQYPSIYRKGMR